MKEYWNHKDYLLDKEDVEANPQTTFDDYRKVYLADEVDAEMNKYEAETELRVDELKAEIARLGKVVEVQDEIIKSFGIDVRTV